MKITQLFCLVYSQNMKIKSVKNMNGIHATILGNKDTKKGNCSVKVTGKEKAVIKLPITFSDNGDYFAGL